MTRPRFFRFGEALSWRQKFFYSGLFTAIILALWAFASGLGLFDTKLLPSPAATVAALWDLMVSGELFYHAGVSMARIAVGFAVAATVGVTLGSLAGAFARVDAFLAPLHSALRYIPPTAFIGLTILWFGIGETNKVALIFLGLIFFVIQMSRDAVRLVPRMHVQAALTLGANRWEIFTRVMLRSALPDLLAVLRVNLGAAWTFLVVAEIVGAQAGLGYLMALSQRFLQTQKLFALILIVGVLGFVSDTLFARLIRYFSKGRELHGAH